MHQGYSNGRQKTEAKGINLFIQRYIADDLCTAARTWYASKPDDIGLNIWYGKPDTVKVKNVRYIYATNIETIEDNLLFDAVADCRLVAVKWLDGGEKHVVVSQRLTIQCKVKYNNGFTDFEWLSAYPGDAVRKGRREYPADADLVPVIWKDDLDMEAERFLQIYCPEALTTPMPVPIMKILKEKMGLTVQNGGELKVRAGADNGQVFGQIFFSPTPIEFQCPDTKKMKTGIASSGTVLFDTSVLYSNSLGSINYTLAHEAYHWFRHRMYAAICTLLNGDTCIACRDSKIMPLNGKWTSEHRIEWQAEKVAPRILMPRESFKMKARELFAKYKGSLHARDIVIKKLADFFIVSKESVRIRLMETGFITYNDDQRIRNTNVTMRISTEDAFRE